MRAVEEQGANEAVAEEHEDAQHEKVDRASDEAAEGPFRGVHGCRAGCQSLREFQRSVMRKCGARRQRRRSRRRCRC